MLKIAILDDYAKIALEPRTKGRGPTTTGL